MWSYICGARSFIFWIIFFFIILLILWFFYGGGNYEFIGLKTLNPPEIPVNPEIPCEMKGVCMPALNDESVISIAYPVVTTDINNSKQSTKNLGLSEIIDKKIESNPVNHRISRNIPEEFIQPYNGGKSSNG